MRKTVHYPKERKESNVVLFWITSTQSSQSGRQSKESSDNSTILDNNRLLCYPSYLLGGNR